MKKFAIIASALCLIITLVFCIAACSPAEQASYLVSKAADEFNVLRRITVINTRDNTVLYEITGYSSIQGSTTGGELTFISKIGEDTYKKDFIYINDWVTYIVEDISGAEITDPYYYDISILPQYDGGLIQHYIIEALKGEAD